MSAIFVKVLTDPKGWQTKMGVEMFRTMVAVRDEPKGYTMVGPERFTPRLRVNACLSLTRTVRGDSGITVSDECFIYEIADFVPLQSAVNSVFNAAITDIAPLYDLPETNTDRFTIKGQVTFITIVFNSPAKGTHMWKRREITVQDHTRSIRVKLWGDKVDIIDDSFLNKVAIVKNIRLDRWGTRVAMGSTDETMISFDEAANYTTETVLLGVSNEDEVRIMCSNGSDFKVHDTISYAVVKALRNHRVRITVENREVTAVLPARSPLAPIRPTGGNQSTAAASSGTCSNMLNSATNSGASEDHHDLSQSTRKGAYSALSDSESDCFAEASDEAEEELPDLVPLKQHRSRNKSGTPTVEEAIAKDNCDVEGDSDSTDKEPPKGKGKGKKSSTAEKEISTKKSVSTPQCISQPTATDLQAAETASQTEENNLENAAPSSVTSKRKRKVTQDPGVAHPAAGDLADNTAVPIPKPDDPPQEPANVATKASDNKIATGPASKRRKQAKN